MDEERRESLRRSLRNLAAAYAETMTLLEQTYELLSEELALDPFEFINTRPRAAGATDDKANLVIDESRLIVSFRDRTCYLGPTLPLRLLTRLARACGQYVTHETLLDEVWGGAHRSDTVVRGVVKVLRQKLRDAGMSDLAAAIDGSAPGRYALRLPQ